MELEVLRGEWNEGKCTDKSLVPNKDWWGAVKLKIKSKHQSAHTGQFPVSVSSTIVLPLILIWLWWQGGSLLLIFVHCYHFAVLGVNQIEVALIITVSGTPLEQWWVQYDILANTNPHTQTHNTPRWPADNKYNLQESTVVSNPARNTVPKHKIFFSRWIKKIQLLNELQFFLEQKKTNLSS